MKLLKISLLSLATIFSLVFAPATFAEEENVPLKTTSYKLSEVKIENLELISQKGNEINFSFVLKGGDRAESGIKYGVSLYPKEEYVKLDEIAYPETLTVEKNSEIKKEVTYQAPSSLEGSYDIRVTTYNNQNITLGISDRLNITLSPVSKIAKIVPTSCYLYETADETKTKKQDLVLTMVSDKPLSLFCQLKNESQRELVVTPTYEIFKDSIYGEKIAEAQKFENITLQAEEEKSVSWPMPTPTVINPEVVKVYLESGGVFSNSVFAKYSLEGNAQSTSIKNIFLDKTFYNKGDELSLSLLWFSSLNQEDLILKVSVTDKKGKECLPETIQTSPEKGNTTVKENVLNKCANPNVLIKIEDTEGNILTEDSLAFESVRKIDGSLITDIIILALIIILVVAGIVIFFVKPKNKKEELKNNENINNEINQ
jgi:hypothetical protein